MSLVLDTMVDYYGLRCYGLRFSLHTQRALPRRGYHGSWLRGMIGHALFRGQCVYDSPRCARCSMRSHCAYPQIFKPSEIPGCNTLPGYVLHDWCLGPTSRQIWFSLLLIGDAAATAVDWIRHIHEFAPRLDMGGGGGGTLGDVRDLATGSRIFADGQFIHGAGLHPLPLPIIASPVINVRFVTGLVTRHDLELDPLRRPLKTRIQRLINDYANGERLELPDSPWRISDVRLRSVAVPRGAGTPRTVSGYLGEVVLEDVTPEGAALLGAGLYFHAGGETSLGFGRYKCERCA